jgi:hypothetical protein
MNSPELRFFGQWCREPCRAEWTTGLDAGAVLRLAEGNRILALLGRELPAAAPGGLADACDVAYADTLRRSRELLALTGTAVESLRASRIDALPLRGPVMAQRYHGDAALRPSHDIDLLVRRDDVSAAHSVL